MAMPAGTYYVGDLCYVMNDAWDEVCGLTIKGHDCLEGEFTLKDGRRFAMYSTKYGDGVYYDQDGGSYSVDAGSIGCILMSDIKDPNPFVKGGQEKFFGSEFSTSAIAGTIHFGAVAIDTGGSDYYDDLYEDDEDY